jgi:hypothetical protein
LPPPMHPPSPPWCPTAEDNDSELDNSYNNNHFASGACWSCPHCNKEAGTSIYDHATETEFEKLQKEQKAANLSMYHPFKSVAKYCLAKWAFKNLGHGQIDQMLGLEAVSDNDKRRRSFYKSCPRCCSTPWQPLPSIIHTLSYGKLMSYQQVQVGHAKTILRLVLRRTLLGFQRNRMSNSGCKMAVRFSVRSMAIPPSKMTG